MAQKKITELQLRSEVTDGLNFPSDDGTQSYRVTGAQVKEYVFPDESVTQAKLAPEVAAGFTPPGVIAPYIAETAPSGWLLCDGAAVSRTTYATLFALISTNFGNGDGTTTFNLPDMRGRFLRGKINIPNVTGSGSASSNNGTFTAHGYTRKGTRVRLASGTLSGLTTNTDYFVIPIDQDTLAFANSYANALADTKIVISGSNTAVITQWEDPDASSRVASAPGGSTGNNLGSLQFDQLKSHTHDVATRDPSTGNNGIGRGTNPAATYQTGSTGGSETRPVNILVNYIIKT